MQQIPENFGNYTIKGIEEIHFPEPVSWLPQTIGWYGVALLALTGLIWMGWRQLKRWRQNRYRRHAVREIEALETNLPHDTYHALAPLPVLLKRTALEAFPRTDIASLTGDQWLAFLNQSADTANFDDRLLIIAYRPRDDWPSKRVEAVEILTTAKSWIRQHKRQDHG